MNRRRKKWSNSDINYLKKHSTSIKTKTIAKYLSRTVTAIYNKASELNVSLKPKDK